MNRIIKEEGNQHTGLRTILFTLVNKTAGFGSELVCDNLAYSEYKIHYVPTILQDAHNRSMISPFKLY